MNPILNSINQPISFPVSDWKAPDFPPREQIEGQNCLLEPLNPKRHVASLYAAYALDIEGRKWTYLPYGPFKTI